jgi:hypothetical protein
MEAEGTGLMTWGILDQSLDFSTDLLVSAFHTLFRRWHEYITISFYVCANSEASKLSVPYIEACFAYVF